MSVCVYLNSITSPAETLKVCVVSVQVVVAVELAGVVVEQVIEVSLSLWRTVIVTVSEFEPEACTAVWTNRVLTVHADGTRRFSVPAIAAIVACPIGTK